MDHRLQDYFHKVIATLERAGYPPSLIRVSFLRAFLAESALAVIVVYFVSLLLGLILASALLAGSIFFEEGLLLYVVIGLVLVNFSVLQFYSLSGLCTKKAVLAMTFSLSILVSVGVFIVHYVMVSILDAVLVVGSEQLSSAIISYMKEPIDVWSFNILVLLTFNVVSLITLLKPDPNEQKTT